MYVNILFYDDFKLSPTWKIMNGIMDEKYHIKKGQKLNFCLNYCLYGHCEGNGNPPCSIALLLCAGGQEEAGRAAFSGPQRTIEMKC